MNCRYCNGAGKLNDDGKCPPCGGHGHNLDGWGWPYESAPVYAREHELPGEGWRRTDPSFGDDPAWVRWSPESGQRKADTYRWRVRDLDREGNVVRVYEPRPR